MDDNLSDVQCILKNGKNYTHLIPITSNTLNVLCHALT